MLALTQLMRNKGPNRSSGGKKRPASKPRGEEITPEVLRLNQFIAHAGVCSRREADGLIKAGKIILNGQKVTDLGIKVSPTDKVTYQGKVLKPQRFIYLLLNKPKDFITTTSDPQERKTVMQLVKKACPERIYPVGRLDRNTTGLLLFTNDGSLAEKLAHPSHQVRKIYQVDLDKPISKEDFQKLADGVELEDGPARPDDMAVLTPDRRTLGLELHIGKNRVVRRIFETLGYDVEKLDRVGYAGLTKRDLPRGKWRFLKPREVALLKMRKK